MSNDHISLTPELLLSQAAEMASLRQEYAQMFQQVSKDLGEINGSWSEYLANNFQGKIESVQRGLNNVLGMLDNGSAAARLCVSDLGSLDGTLGKQLGGSGVYDAFKQAFGGSWQGFWDEKKADYEVTVTYTGLDAAALIEKTGLILQTSDDTANEKKTRSSDNKPGTTNTQKISKAGKNQDVDDFGMTDDEWVAMFEAMTPDERDAYLNSVAYGSATDNNVQVLMTKIIDTTGVDDD